ncbi:MAG: adenosylmethionine decarboxylase [Candidatus Paceibacteria bacterium]
MSYKSPDTGNEISCIMHGISDNLLKDTKKLEEKLLDALRVDKFNVLDKVSHVFTPQGFTIAILLAESHVAVHTYPEYNSLYFNLYSCRGEKDGEKTYELLKEYLKPESVDFSENKIFVGRE